MTTLLAVLTCLMGMLFIASTEPWEYLFFALMIASTIALGIVDVKREEEISRLKKENAWLKKLTPQKRNIMNIQRTWRKGRKWKTM